MKRVIAIVLIFCFALYFAPDAEKKRESLPFVEEKYDEVLVPIPKNVPALKIKNGLLLNERETEYYLNETWDSSKTLEQNRRALTDEFMKTCIDAVEDFFHGHKGLCLKIKGQFSGVVLTGAAQIVKLDERELTNIIYLMTDSPTFCRLIRALLTKYKTAPHRPQRALFLFTKGEANHSSYDGLRYVLNVRKSDRVVLSALDCSKHKMSFGEIVFHEMLHWYHRVSDPIAYEKRGKSTSCIRRRAYLANNFYCSEEIAKYLTNDEEYYTIYGLREENGELVLDVLCEAVYTYEQDRYIRASHAYFGGRFKAERDFILRNRDVSLLRFFEEN
ncbi:MAG: hypothetical protein LBL99_01930 [Holosporaceae bacterium]|jgi:hypothetical protein|nr:hypothetical protein [Holosporaceae bacterium]